MGLSIILDHDKDREEHAKKLVLHHLKKHDKEYPRIVGAAMAHTPSTCSCGRLFWAPANSDRYDCYDCAPARGSSRQLGF